MNNFNNGNSRITIAKGIGVLEIDGKGIGG